MDNFDLKKYLAEDKLTTKSTLKEFVGGALESRNDALYDTLVPSSGNADTIEGEMLRAINKIVYRWYNDGDYFFKGYGIETAGAPMAFLATCDEIPQEVQSQMGRLEDKAIDSNGEEAKYETTIKEMLEYILTYIESKEGEYTPSKVDMFDYQPLLSQSNDEEYDDDEEDFYGNGEDYEEEDDEDYYQQENLNEWGSSDQTAFNQSIHKDLGEPTTMPSPFSDNFENAAEEAVDYYWNDWEEYKTDRAGLVDRAKKMYLRRYFPQDFESLVKMFQII